jgi:hypothetical protein
VIRRSPYAYIYMVTKIYIRRTLIIMISIDKQETAKVARRENNVHLDCACFNWLQTAVVVQQIINFSRRLAWTMRPYSKTNDQNKIHRLPQFVTTKFKTYGIERTCHVANYCELCWLSFGPWVPRGSIFFLVLHIYFPFFILKNIYI